MEIYGGSQSVNHLLKLSQTRRPTRRHAAETMQWVRAQLDQCAGLWDGFVMGIPPYGHWINKDNDNIYPLVI